VARTHPHVSASNPSLFENSSILRYQDGDEIVLFHVVPWSTPWVYADRKIELEKRENKAMAQLVLDYTSLVDSKFNSKLEEGRIRVKFEVVASRSNDFDDSPARLIVNKSASVNSCLVIVARSNKSKLAEFFVGSVTSEVIKRSKVPVLVFNE
jgi:nucleotide-binding universal stress UspA family protein